MPKKRKNDFSCKIGFRSLPGLSKAINEGFINLEDKCPDGIELYDDRRLQKPENNKKKELLSINQSSVFREFLFKKKRILKKFIKEIGIKNLDEMRRYITEKKDNLHQFLLSRTGIIADLSSDNFSSTKQKNDTPPQPERLAFNGWIYVKSHQLNSKNLHNENSNKEFLLFQALLQKTEDFILNISKLLNTLHPINDLKKYIDIIYEDGPKYAILYDVLFQQMNKMESID
ncbi:MAG: hypothetical protein ACFFAS_06855 [Promethearchaeota archaeon]